MKNKRALVISIVIFIIVGILALLLILNKGHIGKYALVNVEPVDEQEEEILPKLELKLENEYLSSKNKKETVGMTVTIDGETVTDGATFTSSDEKIVKINKNNELVAVSDGKAIITANYDGMTAEATARVITPIKTMNFTTTNSTIRVGKDLQMKLKVTPSDAYIDTLKYTSSDEKIATVDPSGIVTGIAPGKVKITVYDSYTDTEKSVNLTIKK